MLNWPHSMQTNAPTHHLIFLRHGESTYNEQALFTGHHDAQLTALGKQQAVHAARICHQFDIRIVHTSTLARSIDTSGLITRTLKRPIEFFKSPDLNERDYGKLNGLNKKIAADIYGEDQIFQWRRGFYDRPPEGESLFDTYERASRYYDRHISGHLTSNQTTLLVAHGNTLRALVGYLLCIKNNKFQSIEVAWCCPWVFSFTHHKMTGLKIYKNPTSKGVNRLPSNSSIDLTTV